jgi:amino acid permease
VSHICCYLFPALAASTRRLNDGDEHDDATDGSSIFGAVCNFTKTIVNAGITGLGGAFAISGGCVSIVGIIFCALLSKLSFDLLIYLCIVVNESSTSSSMTTISTKGRIASSSYEELGAAAFGGPGCAIVVISKTLYLFGTMVVYHMVVKENFASAVNNLLPTSLSSSSSWWGQLLQSENAMMVAVGTIVILPLSLLRDLKPLEKSSIFGMIAVTSLVSIVIYLYFTTTPTNTSRSNDGTAAPDDEPSVLYVHWFQVRGGVLQR